MVTPNIIPASLTNWKSSPPVIQDGKVVFAAPDASTVHCINLRDGAAVVGERPPGRRSVPGRGLCRQGLDREQKFGAGLELEEQGRAALASHHRRYAFGPGRRQPERLLSPLAERRDPGHRHRTGTVKAHNRSHPVQGSPGNLLFYDGVVLSQTPEKIVAYPQLTHMLDLANA